jgi:hypothetical protein
VELGPPVHVCDDTCAAELEAFVEAEEREGKEAGPARQDGSRPHRKIPVSVD